MRAGRLDRRVSLYKCTTEKDRFGSTKETLTKYTVLPASIQYVNGSELIKDGEIFNSDFITVTVRYNSQIKTSDELEYNEVHYNITYVEELGRREGMRVTAHKKNT